MKTPQLPAKSPKRGRDETKRPKLSEGQNEAGKTAATRVSKAGREKPEKVRKGVQYTEQSHVTAPTVPYVENICGLELIVVDEWTAESERTDQQDKFPNDPVAEKRKATRNDIQAAAEDRQGAAQDKQAIAKDWQATENQRPAVRNDELFAGVSEKAAEPQHSAGKEKLKRQH